MSAGSRFAAFALGAGSRFAAFALGAGSRFAAFAMISLAACGKGADALADAAAPSAAVPVAVAKEPVLAAYDALREALAMDDLKAAQAAGAALARVVGPVEAAWPAVSAKARDVAAAVDLGQARTAFGEASRALIAALQDKPDLGKLLEVFRCPMTETYQKWVQLAGPLRNPYEGKGMLDCGSKVELKP